MCGQLLSLRHFFFMNKIMWPNHFWIPCRFFFFKGAEHVYDKTAKCYSFVTFLP